MFNLQDLIKARVALAKATREVREATINSDYMQTMALANNPLTGKNPDARKQETALILLNDDDHKLAVSRLLAAQAEAEQLETAVQCLLDERRDAERQADGALKMLQLRAQMRSDAIRSRELGMTYEELLQAEAELGPDFVPGVPE